MPSRTLRPSRRPQFLPKDFTRAIAYHSSAITIFWVLFLFLTLGFGLLSLTYYMRLSQQEQTIQVLMQQLQKSQQTATETQPKAVITSSKPVEVSVTIPAASGTESQMDKKSYEPLVRGAYSPDGTKYAGYDDTTPGRAGIGVITLADKRLRHVILFNPTLESSGSGEKSAKPLSVRWKSNDVIEYDIFLYGETQRVETRTVKIGF